MTLDLDGMEKLARDSAEAHVALTQIERDAPMSMAHRIADDTNHQRIVALAQAANPETILALITIARRAEKMEKALRQIYAFADGRGGPDLSGCIAICVAIARAALPPHEEPKA